MSERLRDINARIASARQISAVVSAMRALAAVRLREARLRLASIERYSQTVAEAISRALPLAPQVGGTAARGGGRVVVALGAEQGFAGGFSERVLQAAAAPGPDGERADELMLVGDRAASVAAQMGIRPAWTSGMAAHLDQIESVAESVADEIWARVAKGASRVSLVYAAPDRGGGMTWRLLAPFDFRRFPAARGAPPPLTHSPAPALLAKLAEEYVFAEVCAALAESFAAENEARIRAMTAARRHVTEIVEALNAEARQTRQEEITSEVVELASASATARADR